MGQRVELSIPVVFLQRWLVNERRVCSWTIN